jgi:hypothetical protein
MPGSLGSPSGECLQLKAELPVVSTGEVASALWAASLEADEEAG